MVRSLVPIMIALAMACTPRSETARLSNDQLVWDQGLLQILTDEVTFGPEFEFDAPLGHLASYQAKIDLYERFQTGLQARVMADQEALKKQEAGQPLPLHLKGVHSIRLNLGVLV